MEVTLVARREEFADMNISLDGGTYDRCRFRNCTLVYSGLLPSNLSDCEFENCVWDFVGPAANALTFMRQLYMAGGDQRDQIEDVLNKVKVSA